MGWFSKKPEGNPKEKAWVLVKRLEGSVNWKDSDGAKTTIHYYLYEAEDGERKMESMQSGENIGLYKSERHNLYCNNVFMWLKGEEYSDIPSYWEKLRDYNEKYIKRLYKNIQRSVRKI